MNRRTLLAAPALLAWPAQAQPNYPDRPINVVVGFLAGGSTDIAARLLVDRMAPHLSPNARMIIDNRPGAGGSIGAEYVARQNPDGYLLAVQSASSQGTNPAALPDTVRYDAVEDFSHIAILGGGPMLIIVPGSSPYRTVAELVAAAKAARSPLLWASSGIGGIGHLTGSLFAHRSGFRGEYVPYRGGSAVLEAMRKAEIDFSAEVLASAYPHVRDGSSRPLAVTSLTRHPLLPDVPTLQECGLNGFEVVTWNLVQGPKGMPEPLLTRLNRAAMEALAEPTLRRRLADAGVDPAESSTPASTRAFAASELDKFRSIVRETGLTLGRT
ncbi:Bug family tripartite tricarboxylate transporter substrate binding protein [Roseococcus sp. YIM B11640]|uniref:Bug family tripartite tricarboxylate transporter substrate binding protein n=1 Tax=Roseococcus sp. YIM B11640 TaxID=3133973 RepID=UPI003C7E7F2D